MTVMWEGGQVLDCSRTWSMRDTCRYPPLEPWLCGGRRPQMARDKRAGEEKKTGKEVLVASRCIEDDEIRYERLAKGAASDA